MLRNSDSVNNRVYVKGLCESVSEGLHVLLRSVSEAQIRMSCSMYRIFWNPAVFLSEVVTTCLILCFLALCSNCKHELKFWTVKNQELGATRSIPLPYGMWRPNVPKGPKGKKMIDLFLGRLWIMAIHAALITWSSGAIKTNEDCAVSLQVYGNTPDWWCMAPLKTIVFWMPIMRANIY